MAAVLSDTSNIYGGATGALDTDFPTWVNNVFQSPPKAAMVMEGDCVPSVTTVEATPTTDYNVFTFPSINGSGPEVEIGGDTIVAFKDTPAIEAFIESFTTPQAAAAWAKHGGFATGNKNMSPSAYPDPITRSTAAPVASATTVVFDMSDQQPAPSAPLPDGANGACSRTSYATPRTSTGPPRNWRMRRAPRTTSEARRIGSAVVLNDGTSGNASTATIVGATTPLVG